MPSLDSMSSDPIYDPPTSKVEELKHLQQQQLEVMALRSFLRSKIFPNLIRML